MLTIAPASPLGHTVSADMTLKMLYIDMALSKDQSFSLREYTVYSTAIIITAYQLLFFDNCFEEPVNNIGVATSYFTLGPFKIVP